MTPSVLLATSIGRGKGYALPLLRSVLPTIRGVDATLVTFDGHASGMVPGTTLHVLAQPDADLCLYGRCARMRESQRLFFLSRRGFTHLYWHDADMVPPADIIEKLLSLNAPVASGIYNVRGAAGLLLPILARPMTKKGKISARYGEVAELPAEGSLIRPSAVGMGCMLVRRDVLERTPFPDPASYTEDGTGEDVRWCLDSGIQPVVDLSLPCWHVDADGTGTRPTAQL